MLVLALVLLIRPELMDSVTSSALVFGTALGASLLVMLVHRWLLPRWGIFIGTEWRRSRHAGA